MKVFPLKTLVKVKVIDGEDFVARIHGISIRSEIKYEVVFWTGFDRKEIWVTEDEIEGQEGARRKTIGYHDFGENK